MTLSEGFWIALIGGFFGIVGSLGATILQGWKWRTGEQPKLRADAATSLTDTSLKLVEAMQVDIDNLRSEVVDLRKENKDLHDQLAEVEDLREWSERLVHQVRSVGLEPVKPRIRKVAA